MTHKDERAERHQQQRVLAAIMDSLIEQKAPDSVSGYKIMDAVQAALSAEPTAPTPGLVYVQQGSQPQGKWIEQSVNLPPAPWKEIGNLLDHWEQVNNDFKCQLQDDFPDLYRSIEQLLITVEQGDTVCMGCFSDGEEPHICPDAVRDSEKEGGTAPKLTRFQCDCGRTLLVEGQVIGKNADDPSAPSPEELAREIMQVFGWNPSANPKTLAVVAALLRKERTRTREEQGCGN